MGKSADAYFTLSCSPIHGEHNTVAGVLVVFQGKLAALQESF